MKEFCMQERVHLKDWLTIMQNTSNKVFLLKGAILVSEALLTFSTEKNITSFDTSAE